MSEEKLFHNIRERLEKATPGPWEEIIHKGPKDGNLWHAQSPNRLQRYAKQDAAFIAVDLLYESNAEVIRNSYDLIAKKRCSEAIAQVKELSDGK